MYVNNRYFGFYEMKLRNPVLSTELHVFYVRPLLQTINSYENNQQDALYRLIYYFKSALHVSGDVFAYHHDYLTVFTVSGSVHPSCCLPAGSNLGEYYQIL
jgi:hypothetical protein